MVDVTTSEDLTLKEALAAPPTDGEQCLNGNNEEMPSLQDKARWVEDANYKTTLPQTHDFLKRKRCKLLD